MGNRFLVKRNVIILQLLQELRHCIVFTIDFEGKVAIFNIYIYQQARLDKTIVSLENYLKKLFPKLKLFHYNLILQSHFSIHKNSILETYRFGRDYYVNGSVNEKGRRSSDNPGYDLRYFFV